MRTKAHITARGLTRSIFLRLSYGAFEEVAPNDTYVNGRKYRRIEYYTGQTVKPNEWDVKKGKHKRNSFLNGQIEKACLRMEAIYSELSYKEALEFDTLKEAIKTDVRLSEIFNKDRVIEVKEDYKPPLQFIEEFIGKALVTDGTRKDYNNTLNHLKDFDTYRGKVATWKGIDYQYYLDLVKYLQTVKKLKGSTIDKIVKNLKVFLNYADTEDNIEVNQDFKKTISAKSLFGKVSKEETEHIYLNESEIKQITNADMEDERLSEVRDMFIVACWSGLRISDLSRLQVGNISNGLLSITAKKTNTKVVIPVTDELQAVLNKYPERLPQPVTDQYFNRQLKVMGEKAGIDTPVMAEVKVNGMTVTKQVPKYELITAHTARRSFATNLHQRGIPSSQLMMLTGHATEEAFLRYIKTSAEDNAKAVAKQLKKII